MKPGSFKALSVYSRGVERVFLRGFRALSRVFQGYIKYSVGASCVFQGVPVVYEYFRDLFSDPGQNMDDELKQWMLFDTKMDLLPNSAVKECSKMNSTMDKMFMDPKNDKSAASLKSMN